MNSEISLPSDERSRRWRLVLGGGAADAIDATLSTHDSRMDACLDALYDSNRQGGLGASSPNVARWLGDIRSYFPSSVVQVMQADAIERLDMKRLLLEPEILEAAEPSVQLAATLISLKNLIPAQTRETARTVVRKLVANIERRLATSLQQAITGAINRSARRRHPRHSDIDWNRTIRANLRHYQKDRRTIIPETLWGYGRRSQSLKDIIVCVDQSGSMAGSVVYSSILAATMASMRAVSTRMVVFDTEVVDMTDQLSDPVSVLFGIQLGGGTDIEKALAYSQSLIRRPSDTVFILISDLIEGGNPEGFLSRAEAIVRSGATAVCLLALDDDGAPQFDRRNAATMASFGMPAFAMTPDKFPELMAAALQRQDLSKFANPSR